MREENVERNWGLLILFAPRMGPMTPLFQSVQIEPDVIFMSDARSPIMEINDKRGRLGIGSCISLVNNDTKPLLLLGLGILYPHMIPNNELITKGPPLCLCRILHILVK